MKQHDAESSSKKRHAVCIPYPAQGHINPMLKVAKLLHSRGFHVTFVNTDYNHRRILQSRGPHALDGLHSFRFETIPDGLPWTDVDAKQDMLKLIDSTINNCLAPFKELLLRLNSGSDVPPVSCIVSDASMSFTIDAAEELDLPVALLWTNSATALILYLHYQKLIEKGIIPLKDESNFNLRRHLETEIDWIPSMKTIQLKDFPDFVSPTNHQDLMLDFILHVTGRSKRASAIMINTFENFEHNVLLSLRSLLPQIYPVGPLLSLENRELDRDGEIGKLGLNLWEEETESCFDWLDTKANGAVLYVNFGSITVLTREQLLEFVWGLAGSGKEFLWVVRSGMVDGDASILPADFLSETENRGMLITGWCPQEKVLSHPAIGGFLTHCGWNSTLESIFAGVPMICWPFFADQLTNRKFCCEEWGIGMDIGDEVKREKVEAVVREVIDGEKGNRLKEKVAEWRHMAEEASAPPFGSSYLNFETLVNKVLLRHD